MSEFDKLVGAQVRAERVGAGITQEALAQRLAAHGWNIDPTAVTRIEKGERSLRVGQLYLIAWVLGASPHRLIPSAWGEEDAESKRGTDELLASALRLIALARDEIRTQGGASR